MIQITDYNVISAGTEDQLKNMVKTSLGMGWQPLGGVSIAYVPLRSQESGSGGAIRFSQAMVKSITVLG